VLLAWRLTRSDGAAVASLRAQMGAAISAGSLRSLTAARELGQQIVAGAAEDADALASVAYVRALLLRDYGVGARPDAESALARAQAAKGASAAGAGTLQATAALLALGAGKQGDAQAAAEKALAATPDGAPALLAAARVKIHNADLDGARRDLERLLQRTPDYAEAVVDWAAIWIDLGDPSTASQSLRDQIKRTPDHLRARLLLAEAERALGDRVGEGLEAACRAESKESAALRVGCLLAAAAQSRMAGEHQQAVRSARAAATEIPSEPRLLASVALSLAVLGEVDAADEALAKAKRLARETSVPLAWADMAVRLGRHQVVVPPGGNLLDTAAGPERRLVAVRLLLAYEGPAGMARFLKAVPRGLVLIDPDLHAVSQIGESAARGDHSDLEKRADRGDPVAAYVLGRIFERSDPRQAARRLERALWGHGDACDAGILLKTVIKQLDGSSPPPRVMRELRSRNAQCPAA
jgi:tetratricopeptide (TPR) repeat protein